MIISLNKQHRMIMIMPTMILLPLLCLFLVGQAFGEFNQSQLYALSFLYNSTNGDSWYWQNETEYGSIWNFSDVNVNPCNPRWQGINCTNTNRIVSVELNAHNLTGALPDDVFVNLTGLVELQLKDNHLSSSLPSSLMQLSSLTALDLGDNRLIGKIDAVSALTKLQVLSLPNNIFTGTISAVQGLHDLEGFIAYQNNLSGTLQPLENLTKLSVLIVGSEILQLCARLYSNLVGLNISVETLELLLNETIPQMHNDSRPFISEINPHDLLHKANRFTGSLNFIENLANLTSLNVAGNFLTGKVDAISALTNLRELYLQNNGFTGTIGAIQGLYDLEAFAASDNELNGTLQPFENLTKLGFLYVAENYFEGDLQPLRNLSAIYSLGLGENQLVGDLTALSSMNSITYMSVYTNKLSGDVQTLRNFPKLLYLDTSVNNFTGGVNDLYGLNYLRFAYIFSNFFQGDICSTQEMINLYVLAAGENDFSGGVDCLSRLKEVRQLYLDGNSFTGSVNGLAGMTQMIELILSDNLFSGRLDSIQNMSKIEQLYLGHNKFTGPIDAVGNKISLTSLDVSNNSLSGSISTSIFNNSKNLEYALFTQNRFSGSIPSDAAMNNPKLKFFSVSGNRLIGPLPDIKSPFIEFLDFSSNKFSGQIPESYFKSPVLEHFDASLNCLSRALPSSACNMTSVLDLLLTGLHQAPECDIDKALPTNVVKLPECVWSYSRLERLYLAGNAYDGALEGFNLKNATELSIGNNRFRGTIPTGIYDRHKMSVFDISNNFIEGTLDHVDLIPASDSATFMADINRVSGYLNVVSLESYAQPVYALRGNLISCKTLPNNDVDIDDYSCGSSALENSMYFWLASLFTFVVVYFSVTHMFMTYDNFRETKWYKQSHRLEPSMKIAMNRWKKCFYNESQKSISNNEVSLSKAKPPQKMPIIFGKSVEMPATRQMLDSLRRIRISSVVIALTFAVVSTFVYLGFKRKKYTSHSVQYTYSLSGLYIEGLSPALGIFFIFALGMAMTLRVWFKSFVVEWLDKNSLLSARLDIDKESDNWGKLEHKKSSRERLLWKLGKADSRMEQFYRAVKVIYRAFIISAYFIFVIAINASYVYESTRLGEIELTIIQFAVFVFHHFSNEAQDALVDHLFIDPSRRTDGHMIVNTRSSILARMLFLVFSEMVVPTVSTMLGSDSCFHQAVFSPSHNVNIDTRTTYCIKYWLFQGQPTDECAIYAQVGENLSFQPPFVYSLQCRNALLRSYLPILIYTLAYMAFLSPIWYVWSTYKMESVVDEYVLWDCRKYFCGQNHKDDELKGSLSHGNDSEETDTPIHERDVMRYMREALSFPKNCYSFLLRPNFKTGAIILPDPINSLNKVFLYFLLLLTYGILLPEAALALAVGIFSESLVLHWQICRYINLAGDKNSCEIIENKCINYKVKIHSMLWVGMFFAAVLMGLFLFEMTYDTADYDINSATAICICTSLLPLLGYICFKACQRRLEEKGLDRVYKDVELTVFVRSSIKDREADKTSRHHRDSSTISKE